MNRSILVILGGLPATGKSAVASCLNRGGDFSYLRIDTIEQALRDSGEMGDVGVQASGYMVGYATAADLLDGGNRVLVECVNPFKTTRDAWREVASSRDAGLLEVELFCSSSAEHRRRAESRSVTVPGLALPSWGAIQTREYEPWTDADLHFDTYLLSPAEVAAQILEATEDLTDDLSGSLCASLSDRETSGEAQPC